jgi:hypothetical protein
MYWRGQGIAADPEQACYWVKRTAGKGDVFAQFNYATALSKGLGVAIDLAEALTWFRRAAEAGHYLSQAQLGHCYAKGIGTHVDRIEAFVWLASASRHGVNAATNDLKSLLQEMSEAEKTAAAERLPPLAGKIPLAPAL